MEYEDEKIAALRIKERKSYSIMLRKEYI